MDHRNADGSHAEMCGNGIRLFLHVLVTEGLLDRSTCEAGVLVGTRGGPRRVGATPDGGYWVDMGPARPFGEGEGPLSGQVFSGLAVSMGNPHLACLTDVDIDSLDLDRQRPSSTPALFPDGVNVELVNVLEPGAHIRLRVFERGVGETRSCGTGACAAAYAALAAEGRTEGTVVVDVPGGRLSVQVGPGDDGPHRARRPRLGRRRSARSGSPADAGPSGAVVVLGRRLRHHRLALGAGAPFGSPRPLSWSGRRRTGCAAVEALGVAARVVDLLFDPGAGSGSLIGLLVGWMRPSALPGPGCGMRLGRDASCRPVMTTQVPRRWGVPRWRR